MAVLFAIRPVHCVIRCRLTTYLVETPHNTRSSLCRECFHCICVRFIPCTNAFARGFLLRNRHVLSYWGESSKISSLEYFDHIFVLQARLLQNSRTLDHTCWTIRHIFFLRTSACRVQGCYTPAIVMFYFGDGGGGGLAVIGGGGGARGVLMKRRSQKPWKP